MPVSIYLQIPGINGSVTAAGFENHLEVDTVAFSARNDYHSTSGSDRSGTQMGDFVLKKVMDISCTKLLKAVTMLTPQDELTIKFVRLGGLGATVTTPFLVYSLSDVVIKEYSVSAGGDDIEPTETLTLAYSMIDIKYLTFDQSGRPSDRSVMSYSLRTGTGR